MYYIINTNILLVNCKNTNSYCKIKFGFLRPIYRFYNIFYEVNGVMQIGERLAKIRKERGLTQKDLADKLSMSQQVISNIERNASMPDIVFLEGLADLYEISIDDLIGRKVIPKDGNDLEQQIMSIIEQMDDTGKELSLGLVNQVAQHQGNNNAK